MRTIDEISLEYEFRSIGWWRFLALIIDHILISIISFVILSLSDELFPDYAGIAIYSIVILYFLYFVFTEYFFGKTIGKNIVNLTVFDKDGQRPSFWQSILRNLTRIIEINPFFLGPFPAAIICAINKRSKRLGDIIAKTYVIRDVDLNRDTNASDYENV